MIQRIQSIFLSIVVLFGITWLVALRIEFVQGHMSFNSVYHDVSIFDTSVTNLQLLVFVPFLLNCISILFAVMAIFSSKKSTTKKLIYRLLIVINVFVLFPLSLLAGGDNPDFLSGLFFYCPLIAIISAFTASRYVKKDEDFVRSADRIR